MLPNEYNVVLEQNVCYFALRTSSYSNEMFFPISKDFLIYFILNVYVCKLWIFCAFFHFVLSSRILFYSAHHMIVSSIFVVFNSFSFLLMTFFTFFVLKKLIFRCVFIFNKLNVLKICCLSYLSCYFSEINQ